MQRPSIPAAPSLREGLLQPEEGGLRGPLLVALLLFALHLSCAGSYGIFRDELYFLACGRHLDWGYVDQPPAIALVARISSWLAGGPGGPLWRLRLLPILAHSVTVLLAAGLARRLGARAFATTLAALGCALAPVLLGTGHLLTMNAFEPPLWTLSALLLLSAVERDDAEPLLPLGALLGLGVLNKFSIVFWAAALGLALLCTPARRLLFTRHALGGALLFLLVASPTLLWQATHGWPQLELLQRAAAVKNARITPPRFLVSIWFQAGLLGGLLGLLGLWQLLRGTRQQVVLGLAFLFCLLLFLAGAGKPYYLAPAFPVVLAAGGVALGRRLSPPLQALAGAALLAAGLVAAPLAIPLVSPEQVVALQTALHFEEQRLERKEYNPLPQHFADMFGWQNLASSVAQVWATLTPAQQARTVVSAANYGEAGAIDWYAGDRVGPVLSGHNQYFLWGAEVLKTQPVENVVIVGGTAEEHQGSCTDLKAAAVARSQWAMPYEASLTIWLCTGFKFQAREIWPREKHYD